MKRNLQWSGVCVLFWLSTVLFRLGYAQDVTDWTVWAVSLVVAVAFPIAFGYNIAVYRFYKRTHYLCRETDEEKKADE